MGKYGKGSGLLELCRSMIEDITAIYQLYYLHLYYHSTAKSTSRGIACGALHSGRDKVMLGVTNWLLEVLRLGKRRQSDLQTHKAAACKVEGNNPFSMNRINGLAFKCQW